MRSIGRIDFPEGDDILFTSLDPEGADAMEVALSEANVRFTRGVTEVNVRLSDGTIGTAWADQLVIDPGVGSAFVLAIYKRVCGIA